MIETPKYSDLGIHLEPNSERVESLQYNAAARTLIVTTSRAPYGASRRRIFIREVQQDRYQEIAFSEGSKYFNETVTCQSAALVFSRCRDDNDANYSALCSIHLPEGGLVQLPSPKAVADASKLRVDISRLLTASSDGLVVYVVMAYTPVFVPGFAGAVYWEYKIEKMSTQTGEHEVISVLSTPYA